MVCLYFIYEWILQNKYIGQVSYKNDPWPVWIFMNEWHVLELMILMTIFVIFWTITQGQQKTREIYHGYKTKDHLTSEKLKLFRTNIWRIPLVVIYFKEATYIAKKLFDLCVYILIYIKIHFKIWLFTFWRILNW